MRERIRKAAGIVMILLAAGSCMFFHGKHQGNAGATYECRGQAEPLTRTSARSSGTIDVNTGDADELCLLPGVGETIAGLIIEERESNGLFCYPEDLLSVRGIGQKKLEQIIPFLDLEPTEIESGVK